MTAIDQIRKLCAQAVAVENNDEALDRIISQLREVIREAQMQPSSYSANDTGRN